MFITVDRIVPDQEFVFGDLQFVMTSERKTRLGVNGWVALIDGDPKQDIVFKDDIEVEI